MKSLFYFLAFITCFSCQSQVDFCCIKSDFRFSKNQQFEIVKNSSIVNYKTQIFEISQDEILFFMNFNQISLEINKGLLISDFSVIYQPKSFGFGVVSKNIFNKNLDINSVVAELHSNDSIFILDEIEFNPQTPFFIGAIIAYNF